ncbi:hypothetical protein [Acidipila sp. EB88]|uniref:hypothetical protein n=1 Tax=Acidipila sp. EB88 TaxID=2305226 RepID=UPI000F5DC8FB|nr:hypothetical protein [Acidipila sp. EB88]
MATAQGSAAGAPFAATSQTPAQDAAHAPTVPAAIIQALALAPALQQLDALSHRGAASSVEALALRQQVVERVMLASFDVDDMLARIDAEAAHAGDSRYVLQSQQDKRNAALNLATFAISGALGTAGSAMQLTRNLDHAGNALGVAAGVSALTLSTVQLKGGAGSRRVLLSPYNMLAEVLGEQPNAESHYPSIVDTYLHTPAATDGQLPDNVAPYRSLQDAWYRLHRLQHDDDHRGASLHSVTTEPTDGLKLSAEELTDREAMLRDLHGAVSLLKAELRAVLLSMPPLAAPVVHPVP